MIKKLKIILITLLFCSITMVAYAIQPMEAIKVPLEKGIGLLKDPQYKTQDKRAEQREKIWTIVQKVFDFDQISRLTVARSWREFTPAQRKEFADVFAQLLGTTYLDKIQSGYQNETVRFDSQEVINERKAVVKTKIIREGVETPVDYSLIKRGDTWKIYDVKVEGISLVKNYRTQFHTILDKKTPQELIDQLKEKIKAQKAQNNQN